MPAVSKRLRQQVISHTSTIGVPDNMMYLSDNGHNGERRASSAFKYLIPVAKGRGEGYPYRKSLVHQVGDWAWGQSPHPVKAG